MKDKPLIIMGNGPSLADIDFKLLDGFDTFGLNAAYRAYERMNWYPTYFGCFDYLLNDSHQENFTNLIKDETNKIKKFFFLKQFVDTPRQQKIWLLPYGNFDFLPKDTADFYYFNDGGSSGANASQIGICLGYKKIILVGVDCNYVEYISESKKVDEKLVIESTPQKNPNYWFDDYQQKGDVYNIPRGAEFHAPTWEMLARKAKANNIEMVNCSTKTTLKCFDIKDLKTELEKYK
jgi:hypothetical protein